MAELGIFIAEKLIEVVSYAIIKEICDIWGYKSELESLKETVCTIRSVLLDAETRELCNEEQLYVRKLMDVVYDADDLFDEFITLAELKQLQHKSKHGKFFEKVRSFFSSHKKVSVAYRMSQQVKEIRKSLVSVVDNHKNFGLCVDYKPIVRRREETCSYVDVKEIIGRENDKKVIIDMLLNSNDVDNVEFLTIVGVGGLGKTALAQIVFNDEKVKIEFSDLRLWVCVSDQDGENFDVKMILCRILEQAGSGKVDANCGMEMVQNQFLKNFQGRKYLLVLDDVWNEDRGEWVNLRKFLMLGHGGSRVLVTTRSKMTAEIIGSDDHVHYLKGLSPESSMSLFEMTAFKKGEDLEYHGELVDIGKKIVKRCSNVPLAIKVVGSILYGQDIGKWRSFEERGLAEIRDGDNDIMSILKLSYYNLNSSLKNCFTYCAVFPKDTKMKRDMLISVWMAQSYIVPFDRGQSLEDAAKEHFLILLRRCFFQDVVKDEYGDIVSVKMHDLMHDVAQEVRREEISVTISLANKWGDKIRHLNYIGDTQPNSPIHNNKFRTFICGSIPFRQLDSNLSLLRVLVLSYKPDGVPCDPIGKLLHLRYLDLSVSGNVESLPNSITELHNLQTLIIHSSCIRVLSKNLSRLTKLRHLDLDCAYLSGMPSGMYKMTSLRVLTNFVVGKGERTSTEHCDGKLKDLKALTNIEGTICIKIGKNFSDEEGLMNSEEGYLKSMQYLKEVEIRFDEGCVDFEAVMGKMDPHSNLKGFVLRGYRGSTIPRWGTSQDNWAISLPHLVKIDLESCHELKELPLLSKLPYLKSLRLSCLYKLEYIENTSNSSNQSMKFFPSLELLVINSLRSLKGWRRVGNGYNDIRILGKEMSFPRLSVLFILSCSNLISFPRCPRLEKLELKFNHKNLRIIENIRDKDNDDIRLSSVHIDTSEGLDLVRSPCLSHLTINLRDVKSFSKIAEVFQISASTLQALKITYCRDARTLHGIGLEHLTSLNALYLCNIKDDNDVQENGMPWKSLNQTLRTLILSYADITMKCFSGVQYLTSLHRLHLIHNKCQSLPEWISSLTSLRSLTFEDCGLKSLPESIRGLTSLQRLQIWGCTTLRATCDERFGEDWPKIKHIPYIHLVLKLLLSLVDDNCSDSH